MNPQSARVALLTGVSGFVGANLARRLMHEGWEVHSAVRDASRLEEDLQRGQMKAHAIDGSTQGIIRLMQDVRPTVVFHLASLFIAEHKPEQVEPLIASNVLFATQLLEGMKEAGVRYLVNTGTSWQHYENEAYNPVCLYAATKQAFEDIAKYYVEAASLRVVTLQLFDTYGPGDRRQKLFALLRKAADSGAVLTMSPGEQLIDLVHIEDVTKAFLMAADRLVSEQGGGCEVYAVSSGRPLMLRDLVDLYAKATGHRPEVVWGGRAYRNREVMVPWNKGQAVPGWRPTVPLEEGLRSLC